MRLFFICVTSVTLLFCSSCSREDVAKALVSAIPEESNIKKLGWKAEDYFDDPQIITYCNAIEKGDIETMNKLVAEGIDVNTKGKDAMSPVFWSFYAGDKVFEKVLAVGGDPNYVVGGDPNYTLEGDPDFKDTKKRDEVGSIRFGKRGKLLQLEKGRAIFDLATAYCCKHGFDRHIDILLKYGANPQVGFGGGAVDWLLLSCGRGKELEKKYDRFLQQMIDSGIDLNFNNGGYYYIVTAAANMRFNAAILLLESGATYDITTIPGGELQRILFDYKTDEVVNKEFKKDYQRLVKWLEDHGVSFDKPVPKEVSTKKPEPVRKKPKMVPNEE